MARRPINWTTEDKARWLAELARAVDEAQQLVWRICAGGGDSGRANALYGQLEAARDEIDSLRRGAARSTRLKIDPEWISLIELAACEAAAHTPVGMSPPPENG